jgi:hypothetical protein
MLLEGPSMTAETPRAEQIAEIIHQAFDRSLSEFGRLTLGARRHFEAQDWASAQQDWLARLERPVRLRAGRARDGDDRFLDAVPRRDLQGGP